MTQFLYFFPGIPTATVSRQRVAATFANTALRDLLRSDKTWAGNAVIYNQCLVDGPGGLTGTILAALPPNGFPDGVVPAFVRDRQTWVQIDDAWLGWYTDMPPTEQSLRRPQVVSGYLVQLNDDCDWMAPTIRCVPAGSRVTLPMCISLSSSGQREYRVKPGYQHWQELADSLWQHKFNATMNNGELWDAAGELLSLNYRIGPKEVDALGLFELLDQNSDIAPNWFQIVDAAYDWPLVEEQMAESAKKKPQPEGSEQPAGSEVATPLDAA
jgi:hypothetical protein